MNGSNLLTTIFCTTVGFFVGAMVARLLPNHLLDWGNAPEWVAALSALATAIFAWKALTVWREEMRGGSKHAAAAEIAEAASLTRYYFYEARIPMYLVDEYPEPYHALKPEDRDEVGAWRHIFNNRYKGVHEQVLRLATLRAKAYALLGIEVASAVEALARQATGLRRFFEDRIEQIKDGPHIVAQYGDQDWVRLVKESVEASDRENSTDRFSLEFESKFTQITKLLKPYL